MKAVDRSKVFRVKFIDIHMDGSEGAVLSGDSSPHICDSTSGGGIFKQSTAPHVHSLDARVRSIMMEGMTSNHETVE